MLYPLEIRSIFPNITVNHSNRDHFNGSLNFLIISHNSIVMTIETIAILAKN